MCAAWVHILRDPLDGPRFSRRIAALEHHNNTLPAGFDPTLQLYQFDLKLFDAVLIVFLFHPPIIGIAGFEDVTLAPVFDSLPNGFGCIMFKVVRDCTVKG